MQFHMLKRYKTTKRYKTQQKSTNCQQNNYPVELQGFIYSQRNDSRPICWQNVSVRFCPIPDVEPTGIYVVGKGNWKEREVGKFQFARYFPTYTETFQFRTFQLLVLTNCPFQLLVSNPQPDVSVLSMKRSLLTFICLYFLQNWNLLCRKSTEQCKLWIYISLFQIWRLI